MSAAFNAAINKKRVGAAVYLNFREKATLLPLLHSEQAYKLKFTLAAHIF